MDNEQARARLLSERAEVEDLLRGTERAGLQDRETEDDSAETGDSADAAQPLAAEGQDDAIAESLRDRLAVLDRALKRLDDGSYGRSVRSGVPIPPERLEADPAAELTIEEARAALLGAALSAKKYSMPRSRRGTTGHAPGACMSPSFAYVTASSGH